MPKSFKSLIALDVGRHKAGSYAFFRVQLSNEKYDKAPVLPALLNLRESAQPISKQNQL